MKFWKLDNFLNIFRSKITFLASKEVNYLYLVNLNVINVWKLYTSCELELKFLRIGVEVKYKIHMLN